MDKLHHRFVTEEKKMWPGPGSHGRSPDLVGRSAEFARLTSVINNVTMGVQTIQLSGDPWIGKTRLLTEFVKLARSRRWTVLSGSADAGFCAPPGGIPFGAFADAFDDIPVRDRTGILDRVSEEHQRWLVRILPALSRIRPRGPFSSGLEDVNTAIHALLRSLSPPAGLLLVIDDAHLADQESLDLLCHLARHPPADRFVLALAYRRRQVEFRTLSVLGKLQENYRTHQVELTPLPDEDAVALLPDELSDLRNQALLRCGRGNPRVLRALGSVGVLPGSPEDSLHHLPQEALAACFRDFRALSRFGWLTAQAAAVVAEPCETDLVKTVAELTATEVWAALDELTAADVLRIDDATHKFRFRDPLLRTAAYRSAGAGWRIGAQRRAATWLQTSSAHHVALAHHLLGSVDARGTTGVQLVLDAAETVLWERPTWAASWVRAMLGSAPPEGRVSAQQHLLLGKSLVLTGPLTEASAALDRTEESELSDPEVLADLGQWRATAARLLGQHAKAATQVRHILQSLPPDATDSRARLHAELVAIALECNVTPNRADVAAVRRATGSPGTDIGLRAHALALLAVTDAQQPESAADALTAGQLADALSDDEIIRYPHMLLWLARAELRQRRTDTARTRLERTAGIARRRALTGLVPPFALELATLAARGGDIEAAETHAHDAAQAARLIGSTVLAEAARDLQTQLAVAALSGDDVWESDPSCRAAVSDDPKRPRIDDPPTMVPSEEGQDGSATMPELDQLSERELEIAVLISKGRTNQQIAHTLKLSHKTVETYLARIFKKLRICSRTQVATLIGRNHRLWVPT